MNALSRPLLLTSLTSLAFTIGIPAASDAAEIYIAMHNGGTTNNGMGTRPAGDLVDTAADTWNNPARNGGGAPNLGLGLAFTDFPLLGADGVDSGATLDVDSGFTTFNNNGWGGGTQDHVMMEGWYGFGNAESFTVNNLPAEFTSGGYSVFIYGDSNATDRTMTYTIDGQTVTIEDMANFTVASGATFEEGVNFAVISGLTTSSFTILGNDTAVTPGRSAINGIRIIPDPADFIVSFTADVEFVGPGGDVQLSWETAPGFSSVSIDNGVGDVTAQTDAGTGVGSTIANPTATTTYTLTVTDGGGTTDLATVTVIVGPPVINDFSVDGSEFVEAGSPVTLNFDVSAAEALTITPGDLVVTGETSVVVNPTESTTYTLTATNSLGSNSAELSVTTFPFPPPAVLFNASTAGNTDSIWTNEIGTNNWALTGAVLDLAVVSPGTTLTAAYSLTSPDLTQGGAVAAIPHGDRTLELWIRPGDLTGDYQVVFETGGGQNGASILINETEIRFLGHGGGIPGGPDVRTVDFALPLASIDTSDFFQVTFALDDAADMVTLYVKDTAGNSLSATAAGNVILGGNGAGLFTYASGALGTTPNNLGGHTEDPTIQLPNLTAFAGEIALIVGYNATLTADNVQATFEEVALPINLAPFAITDVSASTAGDSISITWNSKSGRLYSVYTSTDGQAWGEFADSIESEGTSTSFDLPVPANTPTLLIRVEEPE